MILVTGSTGFVGRHLVPRLVEAGWPVRVVATPGRGGTFQLPWPNLRVEPVEASLNDGASLAAAMQGVHTVFHLASAQWWGGPQALEQVEVEGMRRVLEAARQARIGRLVVMSHLGPRPSSAYALLRTKGQMEALVQRSGVPYTILRSGVVFGYEDRFVNGIAMLLRTNPLVFIQPGQGETLLHPAVHRRPVRGAGAEHGQPGYGRPGDRGRRPGVRLLQRDGTDGDAGHAGPAHGGRRCHLMRCGL